MKTISVNGTDVVCSHEVKTDGKTQHTGVHLTVKAEDVELTHVMTIGAIDEPLPDGYNADALQKDFDKFSQRHAALAESKLRAKKLAANLI